MSMTSKKPKQLDEERCFNLWVEVGTLEKASKQLEKQGKFNKYTKKSFTPAAIRHAALRYMIRNIDETKKKFEEIDPMSSHLLTEATWHKYIAKRACEILQYKPDYCYDWAEANGIPKEIIDGYLE